MVHSNNSIRRDGNIKYNIINGKEWKNIGEISMLCCLFLWTACRRRKEKKVYALWLVLEHIFTFCLFVLLSALRRTTHIWMYGWWRFIVSTIYVKSFVFILQFSKNLIIPLTHLHKAKVLLDGWSHLDE